MKTYNAPHKLTLIPCNDNPTVRVYSRLLPLYYPLYLKLRLTFPKIWPARSLSRNSEEIGARQSHEYAQLSDCKRTAAAEHNHLQLPLESFCLTVSSQSYKRLENKTISSLPTTSMLIRTKNPNPNLQKNQTKCVHLTTVRLYTTAPPLNNPHPSAGLLATEQPKEGLVMLKQGTGRRPLFKPKLDTVAERTWLKTPAGSAWLTTPPGYNWLETETGREWYMIDGHFWLSTPQGILWSEAKFSRLSLWVTTPEGEQWLTTKGGYMWLRTRQGRYWSRTERGSRWLQLNVQKLSTPSFRLTSWVFKHIRSILVLLRIKNAAPSTTTQTATVRDYDIPRLRTAEGQLWLTTEEGCRWLATEEASYWLSTTKAGAAWLATDPGIDWADTPVGTRWILSDFGARFSAKFTEDHVIWLGTPEGVAWITAQASVNWLDLNCATKWLLTEQGQRWLTTDLGGLWLTTEHGARWLATNLGNTWLETVLGAKWLATEDALTWLQTPPGRKWVFLSEAGDNWRKTPTGRKYYNAAVHRVFNWFSTGAEEGLLHDTDSKWLNTEVGTLWMFETPGGTFWLEHTEHGAKWLNTEHGTQWWFTHVRQLSWLCPKWAEDLWLCTKLSFDQGRIWLTDEAGLSRFLLPDGITAALSTDLGAKWLRSRNARVWLDTPAGAEWLRTKQGAEWYSLNKGGLITPSERVTNWIISSLRKGSRLLLRRPQ